MIAASSTALNLNGDSMPHVPQAVKTVNVGLSTLSALFIFPLPLRRRRRRRRRRRTLSRRF